MDVFEAIESRRSIRRFLPDPVSPAAVSVLLEAARLAPSASNLQTWRFRLVEDERLRRTLREHALNQRFIEEAPLVIVCCADMHAFKDRLKRTLDLVTRGRLRPSLEMALRLARAPREGQEAEDRQVINAAVNVAIAVQNMVLAAVELGLGTCWVRAFNQEAVAETLRLPPGVIPLFLLPVGYPAERPRPRSRKSVEDIMT
ncbi:MAG: nitroreductase family protein [Candidatus Geothermincolia bacterium]